MTRVLVVDDDVVQLRLTSEVAARSGFTPITATGGLQALDLLRADRRIGAMVLDLVMPDLDGMAVLEQMRREHISTPVIVQTAHSSLETVVSAMRQGAMDFFVKPVAPERLVISLRNALKLGELEALVRTERHRRTGALGLSDIVTRAPAMERVLALCAKAGRSAIPVLIEGESGVGKELVARVIHGIGERAGRPFVAVDCAAIPPAQLEALLFGHRKGAVAGANADLPGKFSEAHGGTLFLESVGDLPPELQAKLLRAVETNEIAPLGAARPERVNVRLICATETRLLNLAKAGTFREDLFYRLNVYPIYVPPLRDRPDDIALLAAHYLSRLSAEAGRRVVGISDAALDLLRRYDWPGNARQLENAVYRAIVLCEGAWLEPADFPQLVARAAGRDEALRLAETAALPSAAVHIDDAIVSFRIPAAPVPRDRFLGGDGEVAPLAALERDLIAFALGHYGNRMSRVARALGIGRSTLYRKLREYGLDDGIESNAA